jgi:hypothetical protein
MIQKNLFLQYGNKKTRNLLLISNLLKNLKKLHTKKLLSKHAFFCFLLMFINFFAYNFFVSIFVELFQRRFFDTHIY